MKRLVAPIRNSGHNVTADNWFSDMSLLQELAKNDHLSFVGAPKKNKWQVLKELNNINNRENFSSIFAIRKEGKMVS